MSSDKNSTTNPGTRGGNNNEYREDLYNDLPKEVVDILMQTHPLMSKGDATEVGRSRRHPSRDDIEEVREARMQQVGSEINEIRRAPQQEGEPTRYVSRRARNNFDADAEDTNKTAAGGHKMEKDEYDDGIQYVSVVPSRKKSRITEEAAQQTLSPLKRRRGKKEENAFEEFEAKGRYEAMDFEEKAKQENLDSLYDDYDDEEEYPRGISKLGIILGVIGLILIVFLIFKCVSLGSKLEEAQKQVTANEELNTKYEKIQLEKMQLEEELASLQGTEGGETLADSDAEDASQGASQEGSDSSNTATSETSATEYVVQEGDNAWSIAQKVLGNGAEYKKILDANNMKETDTMSVGTKLKIPRG